MLDDSSQCDPMQRARGEAEVVFGPNGVRHLYQQGCAKALLPRSFDSPLPQAVFINTSGGITGGDKLRFMAGVEQDGQLTVTTQAAERIYRSSGGHGAVLNKLTVAQGGRLEWLPQETILFDGGQLKRQLNAELDEKATLLAAETIVLGRKAMGETLKAVSMTDSWRISRGGRLIFADTIRLETDMLAELANRATLNNHRCFTTIVYVGQDAETRIDTARGLLPDGEVEAAASAWNNMLHVRFLAPDLQPLKAAIMVFLEQFRGQPLPRVWYM